MGWYVITIDYEPPSTLPPSEASLIATFNDSVVIGGSFAFRGVQGTSHANAFATIFSFSVPAGGSGGPSAYLADAATLSGTLTSNSALPFDVSVIINTDPFGAGEVIGTLAANTTSAPITWSGNPSAPGFTAAQLRERQLRK